MNPTVVCVRSIDADILGPEQLILGMGAELVSRGKRFVLVSLWDGEPPRAVLHEEATRRGLESHRIDLRWGTDPSVVPRLRRLLLAARPCVVWTHDQKSELSAVLATRFAGVPLVGSYYGRLAIRSLRIRAQEATSFASFRLFRRVLANSTAQRDDLLRWGLRPTSVEVFPSFIDTRAMHRATPGQRYAARSALGLTVDQPVVTTVARLSLQKGHTYMLDALPALTGALPGLTYLVVGDGDASWHGEGGLRAVLERRAAELGVAHAVRFLGYRRDLERVLHATDVLVSPSLREGMSVILLDAMAAGVPVVATAVGGGPEVVADGGTGWLIPPADSRALESAILRAFADRRRLAAMGVAARRRVEARFDVRAVADQLTHICEAVAAGA